MSRSLRDTAYKALSAKEKLMRETETEPSVDQIAKEIGIAKYDDIPEDQLKEMTGQ